MNLFQAIFVPLCGLMALVTFARTVRGQIVRRSGLLWTLLWIGAAGLILEPSSATRIAQAFGIGRGADLVFYCAILAGLAAALYFYARFRSLEVLLTGLIRREALAHPRVGGSDQKSS
jgi:hypothetical protein